MHGCGSGSWPAGDAPTHASHARGMRCNAAFTLPVVVASCRVMCGREAGLAYVPVFRQTCP